MMSLAACVRRWPSTTRCPWFENSLLREERLEHRGFGLLELQEQRVVAVAAEQQRDPDPRADAADPDDLAGGVRRAGSARAASCDPPTVSAGRSGARARMKSSISCARSGPARSSIGTITGGSLMIRGSPSTISVIFANAFRLSLALAFATFCSKRRRCSALARAVQRAASSARSDRAYHRSKLRMPANVAIASR